MLDIRDARLEVDRRLPFTLIPNAPDLFPMIVSWCLRLVALDGLSVSSSDMGGLGGFSSSGQRCVSARDAARMYGLEV